MVNIGDNSYLLGAHFHPSSSDILHPSLNLIKIPTLNVVLTSCVNDVLKSKALQLQTLAQSSSLDFVI